MTTSKTIAALVGPTLAALTLSMLVNLGSLPLLTEQISREPALILVSGPPVHRRVGHRARS